MTLTKSVFGLLCLSVLCLAAFGASSASAYTLHLCVAQGSHGTGVLYTSSTCETQSASGTFETKPLPLDVFTAAKATPTSIFVLKATVGGVVFSVTCKGPEAPGLEVADEEVGTPSEKIVTDRNGTFRLIICSVTAPTGEGCTVPSTLETVVLKSTTNSSGSTTFDPATGSTFIVIPVTGCSSGGLNGDKAVTGSVTSAWINASRQAFTSTSGSSLAFGGQAAIFTGEYHLTTPTGGTLGLETP